MLAAVAGAALLAGCGNGTGTDGGAAAPLASESGTQPGGSETQTEQLASATPKVAVPAFTADFEPLAHGDASQIAQTVV